MLDPRDEVLDCANSLDFQKKKTSIELYGIRTWTLDRNKKKYTICLCVGTQNAAARIMNPAGRMINPLQWLNFPILPLLAHPPFNILSFLGTRSFDSYCSSSNVHAFKSNACIASASRNRSATSTSCRIRTQTMHSFFANKIHFFTNFEAFSPSGVSFSPTFLTMRAFFTLNRQHRIGPYPGCTNVPPRPPSHHQAHQTSLPCCQHAANIFTKWG